MGMRKKHTYGASILEVHTRWPRLGRTTKCRNGTCVHGPSVPVKEIQSDRFHCTLVASEDGLPMEFLERASQAPCRVDFGDRHVYDAVTPGL